MTTFVGDASDGSPDILAAGSGDISTMFVSMARRHPAGEDADYLRWHTLDHRPEQHRLSSLRASLRIVSTPACRAARLAGDERLADVDHVMAYFWTDVAGLDTFDELSVALRSAGRAPFILPPVDRGVYAVDHRQAAPRVKVGSQVLPWRPVQGVFVLIEEGTAEPPDLTDVPGVAGVWSGAAQPTPYSSVQAGQRLTYCFLDDDPVETTARLRPLLERRWEDLPLTALLAAPFHPVHPYEWDRYLP